MIEHFKVSIRYEAILPSDLNFLKADAGNLMSFMPSGAQWTILIAVAAFAAFVALFVFLNRLDARHGRLFRGSDKQSRSVNAIARLLLILLPGLFFTLYSMQVSTVGSWAKGFATVMGDKPSMWDSVYDAQRNGPLVAFTRQLNPKVMVKPDDYSEETMKQVAARYEKAAKKINAKRSANMTDSTVIYVLSESFSDPSRVPGLKVNKDSMPKIREIKQNTTSGLMLSSGYGGGTANLEYMGLSGLSMANFDSSDQPIPAAGAERALDADNQPDVGRRKELHRPAPVRIVHVFARHQLQEVRLLAFLYVDRSGRHLSSGQARRLAVRLRRGTYKSTLEQVKKTKSNQFLQVITMQNHMPYHKWYKHNDFKATPTTDKPLKDDEQESIETYQKGASLTDDATADFLAELDKLGKPVTVVFYGDHLPGIYSSASADDGNSLALHQTDYFIWSNKASGTQGNKIGNADYSSPNFFVAQAAEHMDAKVSPYLAFLTEMHSKISAMEPPVVNNIQGWDRIPEGQNIYLDSKGNPMAESDFDAETKQLMADYKLIQYDITTGKNYLKDTSFMDLP